jgi:hypothetical protein
MIMPTRQGGLELLNDPVAQELLQARFPMRLAYVWTDGTPRVVPIGFQWDGKDIIIGSPPGAPKLKALEANPNVAITIDTNVAPWHVLLIRGSATLTNHEGIIPEYKDYCYRMMGQEGGETWLQQVSALVKTMVRIAIRPEWVGIIDFDKRLPSAVEKAIAQAMGG